MRQVLKDAFWVAFWILMTIVHIANESWLWLLLSVPVGLMWIGWLAADLQRKS